MSISDTVMPSPGAGLDRVEIQRHTLRVLVSSQVIAGAGLAAGVTVGALLAEDMLGSSQLAGIPAALYTMGSACTVFLVGAFSDRRGRRTGLAGGYLTGALGALGITVAAILGNPVLLFAALFVYGAGSATNLQARYAGGDLAPAHRKGTAVSTVLVASTVGAVAGPNLVAPMGRLAEIVGIPTLSGPFLLSAAAYGSASLILTLWLRPDPLFTARLIEHREAAEAPADKIAVRHTDFRAVRLGGLIMVVAQLTMVAIMTMTPVHMRHNGHGLSATGLVIALHVAGMYLLSPVTGRLVDRFGTVPIASSGGVVLLVSGVLAATAPADSVPLLGLALFLLGLGWNLGLVSGTALIARAASVDYRARIQGRVDVAVALSGALGGVSSGVIVASTSFATLSLGLGVIAVTIVLLAVRAGAERVRAFEAV